MDESLNPSQQELRRLLETIGGGDRAGFRRLLPLVYDELHRRARGMMAGERADHTLQTTAFVHEAYLKLIDSEKLKSQDPRRAEVVTLKFFGGLGEGEIARLLGVTERTVRRDWVAAKLWLSGPNTAPLSKPAPCAPSAS